VAVISGSRLVASVEIEKLDNRLRYHRARRHRSRDRILADLGFKLADIDSFAVDGWDTARSAR